MRSPSEKLLCSSCRCKKPPEEFPFDRNAKTRGGRAYRCRECLRGHTRSRVDRAVLAVLEKILRVEVYVKGVTEELVYARAEKLRDEIEERLGR